MEKLDISTERYIINKFISMPKLFDSLGIDYRVNGNMFCPFHDNAKSPAAHLYYDKSGYRIWCFSEARMYGAWNVYKTFISNVNTNELATLIFNRLSKEEQQSLFDEIGAEQEPEGLPFSDSLKLFKERKISYTELLKAISDSYIDEA